MSKRDNKQLNNSNRKINRYLTASAIITEIVGEELSVTETVPLKNTKSNSNSNIDSNSGDYCDLQNIITNYGYSYNR